MALKSVEKSQLCVGCSCGNCSSGLMGVTPQTGGTPDRFTSPGFLCVQEVATTGRKLEAEDIEKLSDSNADIKSRLSEVVRDNAKHLLDPERRVNGQPVPAQQPHLFTGGVMRWYQVEGIEWLRVGTMATVLGAGGELRFLGAHLNGLSLCWKLVSIGTIHIG